MKYPKITSSEILIQRKEHISNLIIPENVNHRSDFLVGFLNFIIECKKGIYKFFKLSPEKEPLVQIMNLSFKVNKKVMN